MASATAMKFSGVGLLATRTPRADAAGTSILSVPMKGTITSRSDGAASITAAGDRVEVRGEDDVAVARRRAQVGLGIRRAPRLVEGAPDHDLVARRAEGVELAGRSARPRGEDLHGFLQITLRTTWRFSSRTMRSPRRRASGSAAGSSTFSPWPPEARQSIS